MAKHESNELLALIEENYRLEQERDEARHWARRLHKKVQQLEAQINEAKRYEPFKSWSEETIVYK